MPKSNSLFPKKGRKIYMDYASATPLDPRVKGVMDASEKRNFANAGAIHARGVEAKRALESARRSVADTIEARPDEIIFTSGATEANNLAILGTVYSTESKSIPHIVTTNIEHASVLEACRYLEKEKLASVTYVSVEENGIINPKKISKALGKNTVLVSVMYANNEIGTIQPIAEIAKTLRHFQKKSAKKIFFHVDATQAMNYLPVNVLRLGVDLMSWNGGKIYGPKGAGVLFRKRNVPLHPLVRGGNQEYGLRPGTENLSAIMGLAKALELAQKTKEKEGKRVRALRDYFLERLQHSHILLNIGMLVNGDMKDRLPNNLNITISRIPSDLLVIELSAREIMASAKSACKAGDGKASHVIRAIRLGASETDGSLRFSLGRGTAKKDIDYAVRALEDIILHLQKWYAP